MVFLLLLLQLLLWGVVLSADLYFDKYGHCTKMEPFDVTSESYLVRSVGGGFSHERLDCQISFKAPPENGICIAFKKFDIEDCGVALIVYRDKTKNDEKEWKTLDCNDDSPAQMCTPGRYITLQVLKKRLNKNKGYTFEISVEKSTSVTEGGVLFASLGVVIGIIVAVVVLLAVLALIVIKCCRHQVKRETSPNKGRLQSEAHVEPSAPPAPPDMYDPLMSPPPPYTEHAEDSQTF